MTRRHMAKKTTRKSSSTRRVSARPLGFWQFIRKNFLIIAGLLLLPVTVGAVVSSYNYANQSSAAKRNLTTQDSRKYGSLRTMDGVGENQACTSGTDTEKLFGCTKLDASLKADPAGTYKCRVCTDDGCSRTVGATTTNFDCYKTQDCTNQTPVQCGSPAVCTAGNYQIEACPKIDSTGTWTSNGKCRICQPNGQWDTTAFGCTATEYVNRQCGIQVLPKDKVCASGEESLQHCGSNKDGSEIKCLACNADQTGWDRNQACSGNLSNYIDRCFPKTAPDDKGQGGQSDQDGAVSSGEPAAVVSGGGHCANGGVPGDLCCEGGECNDNWSYGSDEHAPQQSCDQRKQEACASHRGSKSGGGVMKKSGTFDVIKAIKNFFGIR